MQQLLFRRGGKRRGAGRKPKGARAGAAHKKRGSLDGREAVHVVLRAVREIGNLRRDEIYAAVRAASVTAARRNRIRIIHMSIQHTHVHMLVEADSAKALAHGMAGFQISAARNINTAMASGGRRRRGSVFVDRYHAVVIRSPKQARSVLAYVLQNWRKHGEDRHWLARTWLVDRYSTAILFTGWRELEGQPPWTIPSGYEPMVVTTPKSWLLRVGWKMHGAISVYEVPRQCPGR